MQLEPLEELATRAILYIITTEIVQIITMEAMLNMAIITITPVVTATIPPIPIVKHRLLQKSRLASMKSKS